MKIKIILIILISSIIWAFFSYIVLEKNKNTNSIQEKIINISEKSSPSVVSIIEEKDLNIFELNNWSLFNNKVWWWSGFFINKDWIIITSKHVVKNINSKYIIILNNWKKYNSKIIYSDKNKDIALLKIISTEKFSSLPLKFVEEKTNLKIWQFILAIWNSFTEFNNSVSFWIISWLNRKIENNYIKQENLIQTDANINPWNSWWPLINLEWKVIWINTLIINWNSNIWFAVKINKEEINKILGKIKILD